MKVFQYTRRQSNKTQQRKFLWKERICIVTKRIFAPYVLHLDIKNFERFDLEKDSGLQQITPCLCIKIVPHMGILTLVCRIEAEKDFILGGDQL